MNVTDQEIQRIPLWCVTSDAQVEAVEALPIPNQTRTFQRVFDCPRCAREQRHQSLLHLGKNAFRTEREAHEEVVRRCQLAVLQAEDTQRRANERIAALPA